jgi:hypothetical protein
MRDIPYDISSYIIPPSVPSYATFVKAVKDMPLPQDLWHVETLPKLSILQKSTQPIEDWWVRKDR